MLLRCDRDATAPCGSVGISHGRRKNPSSRGPESGLLRRVKDQHGYGGAFDTMNAGPGQPIVLPAGPMFLRDREVIAQAFLARGISSDE
jgi:hypothetical protein